MSKRTRENPTQSPKERHAYWLKVFVGKANSAMPEIHKRLIELVRLANQTLTLDDRKKIRVMLANDLGQSLNQLEIPHETDTTKNPESNKESVHTSADTADGAGITEGQADPTGTPTPNDPPTPGTRLENSIGRGSHTEEKATGSEEHVRSGVLPDAGSKDNETPSVASTTEPTKA